MIAFHVAGLPIAQGSKRAFTPKGHRRPIVVESAKGLRPWRAELKAAAVDALNGRPRFDEAVTVLLDFTFPRPKAHYGTGRNAGVLKARAPSRHASMPDADKVARAVLDALAEANVLRDDSLVSDLVVTKRYGVKTGVYVVVTTVELDIAAMVRHVLHHEAAREAAERSAQDGDS